MTRLFTFREYPPAETFDAEIAVEPACRGPARDQFGQLWCERGIRPGEPACHECPRWE